jgi:hypothetical protein
MSKMVSKSLDAAMYLAAHPEAMDIEFSFPCGRKLPASRLLLAMASPVFHNMVFGDWKVEKVIQLTDTNFVAFQIFIKILYSESVDLASLSLHLLDSLYQLADKYLIIEIQNSILEVVQIVASKKLKRLATTNLFPSIPCISLLHNIETAPVKAVVTNLVINFLVNESPIKAAGEFPKLATLYYSGPYDDSVKEAILQAAATHLKKARLMDLSRILEHEESLKFFGEAMQLASQGGFVGLKFYDRE